MLLYEISTYHSQLSMKCQLWPVGDLAGQGDKFEFEPNDPMLKCTRREITPYNYLIESHHLLIGSKN